MIGRQEAMMRWERGRYAIEMVNEPVYSFGSADNLRSYKHEHFLAESDDFPGSKHGFRCILDGQPAGSAVIGASGGGTGVHEHSCVLLEDCCLVAVGDRVAALSLPDLGLLWQVNGDLCTCFGLHLTPDEKHVVVHGELEISKFTMDGHKEWGFGGRDIFTGECTIEKDIVKVTDFNGRQYAIDLELGTESSRPGEPGRRERDVREPGRVQVGAPRVLDLFWSFLRLGMVAFGGPAMVSYIKQLAVYKKRWVTEEEFMEGVALCQAVPGATAMQSVAFVGLRTRKLAGAVAAYVGFGLPAFLLILTLAVVYQYGADVHAVTAAMAGLRTFVVALVANSAWMFGRSSVKKIRDGVFALMTGTLFFVGGSPFLIVAGAGLFGALLFRGHGPAKIPEAGPRLGWHTLYPAALVLIFGAVMVAILFAVDRPLAILALIMMKVDFFAFGGGFASIPLMFREIVNVHGWVPGNVFMDGIALGQVTPGPIVIVATFVGYQILRFTGAVVGTVGIFLPSLFAVVLVEPWFRRLRASAFFQGTLRGLVLSFVGLLVSVTIQFARLAPWSIPSAIIFVLGSFALWRKVPIPWIVGAVAIASTICL